MKFITEDGEPIEGASHEDVVKALRDGGRFTAGQPIDEYMEGFAERIKEWDGSHVRIDNPTVFVDELVRVGYLKKVD
jgi:hypothetical protein